MDNLAVTTATFGTDSIIATGTEYYPHTSQAQVGNNTGYNFYTPRFAASQPDELTVVGDTGTDASTTKAYLAAGTYMVYAQGYSVIAGGASQGTNQIKFDGTLIVEDGSGVSSGWIGSNNEIIVTTTGWVDTTWLSYTADATDASSLKWSTIYIRQTN